MQYLKQIIMKGDYGTILNIPRAPRKKAAGPGAGAYSLGFRRWKRIRGAFREGRLAARLYLSQMGERP